MNPFLEQAQDRDLRRELFHKNWNKAVAANRPLLDEALDLRRRVAVLLGHPTWAHHAMEVKMAREPERVADFYEELVPPLAGQVRNELDRLAEGLHADGHEGPITAWDHRYYDDALRRTEFGVDQNRISEYFPLERVLDGMFEISGEVLGFEVRSVDGRARLARIGRTYEIRDTASGTVLAHFYTDLHPREGKFGHAAAFPLVVGIGPATAAGSPRSAPSSRTSRRRRATRRRCSSTARSRRSSTSSGTSCT